MQECRMRTVAVPAAGATAIRPLRLFVALWPDDAQRCAIARWQRQWDWPQQAALVKSDRLHVTLHFLGDIAAIRLPELKRALKLPFEPFELTLGTVAVWSNGVAVLRPDVLPPQLASLHAALAAALEKLAIPLDERPYRPHVTLARRAFGATPPAQPLQLRWQVDQGYVLVRSLPGGVGYELLERFA
jgi:RNA 2',3'-cyclic 3'-phosphodiesterase